METLLKSQLNLKQEVIELEEEIALEEWFDQFLPLENQIIDEGEEL